MKILTVPVNLWIPMEHERTSHRFNPLKGMMSPGVEEGGQYSTNFNMGRPSPFSLELCIPCNYYKRIVFKRQIKHTTRTFLGLVHSHKILHLLAPQ